MAEKLSGRRRGHRQGATTPEKKTSNRGKLPIKVGGEQLVLWGRHAVLAAIINSNRFVYQVFCTQNNLEAIAEAMEQRTSNFGREAPPINIISIGEINSLTPKDAVHQGIAAIVRQTEPIRLNQFLNKLGPTTEALVVVLDQVTDPHNLGAVIRSSVAFSADAIMVHDRRSPKPDGVLGKAASGGIERIPILRVTNLVRSINTLKQNGFWCSGLTDDAPKKITDATFNDRVALILGAEGAGLRRLTRETCDELIRLPTASDFSTLNISNAASIALYEVTRRKFPLT